MFNIKVTIYNYKFILAALKTGTDDADHASFFIWGESSIVYNTTVHINIYTQSTYTIILLVPVPRILVLLVYNTATHVPRTCVLASVHSQQSELLDDGS